MNQVKVHRIITDEGVGIELESSKFGIGISMYQENKIIFALLGEDKIKDFHTTLGELIKEKDDTGT